MNEDLKLVVKYDKTFVIGSSGCEGIITIYYKDGNQPVTLRPLRPDEFLSVCHMLDQKFVLFDLTNQKLCILNVDLFPQP